MGDSLTGRTLGDFVVREQLGAGGFGAVYRAEQPLLGRHAVVKVPLTDARANQEYVARFLREARLASKLDHPYAAHIYAFGAEPDGTLWTAMELVRGTPLDRLLREQGAIKLARFVPLFDKICEVVHSAHEQGIVHRDLKPANVMVMARAGRLLPKLLDFGIAKQGTAPTADETSDAPAAPAEATADDGDILTTRAGRQLGSPAYMAPEQWVDAHKADARADIYALGVLAFETLTGRLPFAATRIVEVARAHARSPVPALGPEFPPGVHTVIATAMAKRAADRYGSALEFANAMRAAAGLDREPQKLPEIDALLRDAMTTSAPQPIAEAIAALDGVRSAHQAQAALFQVVRVVVRWLGNVALAMWAQEPEARTDAVGSPIANLLRTLRREGLSDGEWIALARLIAHRLAPRRDSVAMPEFIELFVATREAAPIATGTPAERPGMTLADLTDEQAPTPEATPQVTTTMTTTLIGNLAAAGTPDLRMSMSMRVTAGNVDSVLSEAVRGISASHGGDATIGDAIDALLALKLRLDEGGLNDEATVLAQLSAEVPWVERVLRGLRWLTSYGVLEAAGGQGLQWQGLRRTPRARQPLRGELTDGELYLVNVDGDAILPLSPVMSVLVPAPGHEPELFLLDGGAAHDGARLLALPTGFERTDLRLWGWLRQRVTIALDEHERAALERPPYRGLAAFTRDDADAFVGRERETEAFANRLRVTPLLAVAGPSGAGKSSFIQAGVLAALGPEWEARIVRPGNRPMAALEAMLRRGDVPILDDSLSSPAQVAQACAAWARAHGKHLLLYIDQFEELFTLCLDADERRRYVDTLLAIATDVEAPTRVVLTVRDDFLLRCQQIEALRDRLVHGLQLLAVPTPDDLRRIIVEPARRAGYDFDDPALPTEMVAAIAEQPGALPLLSFTAAQLWDLRDRVALKLPRKAYESLGGVGGALAQHAEKILGAMTDSEQRLVRVAFRNLVTADGTRAVIPRGDLLELLDDNAAAEPTLEKLIGARLLTGTEGAGGQDQVEVVHEALLTAWPRLLNWRREDAEGARLRDQLRAAARQWEDRKRPRGLLWRDEALTEFTLWRARHPGTLTASEQAFADASLREAARGRRVRRIVISTIGALLVGGLVVALILAQRANVQRGRAELQRQRAEVEEARARELARRGLLEQGQRAAAAGDANRAMVYLTEAAVAGVTGAELTIPLAIARRTITAERAVYRSPDKKVWNLRPLRDGRFVTAGADGLVRVWQPNAETPQFVLGEPNAGVFRLAIAPSERMAAAPSFGGGIAVFDLTDGRTLHTFKIGDSPMWVSRFYDNERKLVTIGVTGELHRHDLTTGEALPIIAASASGAQLGEISPDATRFVVPGYDGNATVWEIASGRKLATLTGHKDVISSVAFSPDGATLAMSSWDTTTSLWDTRTWKRTGQLIGHSALLDNAVWDATGSRLATADRNSEIRIWNRDGSPLRVLNCARGQVFSVDWPANPQHLITACGDGTTLWDLDAGLPIATFFGHGSSVFAARMLPSGEILTAGGDGTVRRWHVSSPVRYDVASHQTMVLRAYGCAEGRVLSLDANGQARRFTADGALEWQSDPTRPLTDVACGPRREHYQVDAKGVVERVRFGESAAATVRSLPSQGGWLAPSPAGDLLALIDATGVTQVISLDDAAPRAFAKPSFAPTFEPTLRWFEDGRAFALYTDPGGAVWDVATGQIRFEIKPPGNELRRAIPIGPDDLLVSGKDFVIRRVSATDGRELARYEGEGYPWGLAADATRVYAGFDDGKVIEYDRASGKRLGLLTALGTDILAIDIVGPHIWLSTSSRLELLIDRTSRGVLAQIRVPSETLRTVQADADHRVVAGSLGTLTWITIARDHTPTTILRDEVACLAPFALDDGTLVPHAPDLAACARLASRPRQEPSP